MATDKTRSSTRANYSDDPETPTGIWIVAVVGILGAILGLLSGIGWFIADEFHVAFSVGIVVLSLVQMLTMLALVGLTTWAWYATLVLYSLSAVLNLITGDGSAVVVSLVVVGYVASQGDLYRS
ncbi:MAG: hypothetical protein V5A34_07840 [Halapricum sp.]